MYCNGHVMHTAWSSASSCHLSVLVACHYDSENSLSSQLAWCGCGCKHVLSYFPCEPFPGAKYTATGTCCSCHTVVDVHSYRETLFPCSSSTWYTGSPSTPIPPPSIPTSPNINTLWIVSSLCRKEVYKHYIEVLN